MSVPEQQPYRQIREGLLVKPVGKEVLIHLMGIDNKEPHMMELRQITLSTIEAHNLSKALHDAAKEIDDER